MATADSMAPANITRDDIGLPSAEDLERWKMVRSMVHEMRSVLTAAKIGAEVLVGPRADDAGYRRGYAEMIAEQTGRVARLLEDFSELVRPPAPGLPTEDETADLNAALDGAGRELTGLAGHLEQEMRLTPAAGAALIAGDQVRVTQALRGLLEYFLVSSPRGGAVDVRVDLTAGAADAVTVSFTRRAPAGAAAPDQTLDWTRISPAAARRIVERHGGSLQVAEEAEDLTLLVTFPRERGVLSAARREEPAQLTGVYYLADAKAA
jgi:signal transduction histidine kinase